MKGIIRFWDEHTEGYNEWISLNYFIDIFNQEGVQSTDRISKNLNSFGGYLLKSPIDVPLELDLNEGDSRLRFTFTSEQIQTNANNGVSITWFLKNVYFMVD